MNLDHILNHDAEFRYRLLSRMQSDCEYYLNYGNRCPKHLWAETEKEHVAYMKALWESFPNDMKPEWISYEDILEYEKKMVLEKDFLSARIEDAAARAAGQADLLATLEQKYADFAYLDEFAGYSSQDLNIDLVGCIKEVLTAQNADSIAKFTLQHLNHYVSYCSHAGDTQALREMEDFISHVQSCYGHTFQPALREDFDQVSSGSLSRYIKTHHSEFSRG